MAGEKRAFTQDLLGRVIAHEVGHLLLPRGHTFRGIMQANLELEPQVDQRFTEAQTMALHAALRVSRGR